MYIKFLLGIACEYISSMTTRTTRDDTPWQFYNILTGEHIDWNDYIITDEDGVAFLVLDNNWLKYPTTERSQR